MTHHARALLRNMARYCIIKSVYYYNPESQNHKTLLIHVNDCLNHFYLYLNHWDHRWKRDRDILVLNFFFKAILVWTLTALTNITFHCVSWHSRFRDVRQFQSCVSPCKNQISLFTVASQTNVFLNECRWSVPLLGRLMSELSELLFSRQWPSIRSAMFSATAREEVFTDSGCGVKHTRYSVFVWTAKCCLTLKIEKFLHTTLEGLEDQHNPPKCRWVTCLAPSICTVSRARPSTSAEQEMLRTWENVAKQTGCERHKCDVKI